MKKAGYCCGTWYINESKDLYCSKSTELIEDGYYYRYQEWVYCEKCLDACKSDLVKLDNYT
jgi:hypothetical protein